MFRERFSYNNTETQLNVRVETLVVPLNQLRVMLPEGTTKLNRKQMDKKLLMELPDGRQLLVTPRFWHSFSTLFRLNRSVFDYWQFDEVFARISQSRDQKVIRLCYEYWPDRAAESGAKLVGQALSCTNPTKARLTVDDVSGLIERHGGTGVNYAGGVVNVAFDCPFPLEFQVGGDDFRSMFMLALPVDGYGLPSSYLGLLRQVCTNGMVGMTKAFRTAFQLGSNDVGYNVVLERAISTFNNEEGFEALRLRLDAAANSWASMHDFLGLNRAISTIATADGWKLVKSMEIQEKLDTLAGHPLRHYGVSGINEMSSRVTRTVPVACTVYDIINYATEVGTHHTTIQSGRNRINGWVGELLTSEYDLENSCTTMPSFRDMWLNQTDWTGALVTKPATVEKQV